MQTETQLNNIHHPQHASPTGMLWGAKARMITASFQIVLGVLEVILGITLIVLPLEYSDIADYIGWGIWCGAFSILSGCFGIASRRSKCVAITYMVLSIIAAVMCGVCLNQQIWLAFSVKRIERYSYWYSDEANIRTHFSLYVTLAVSLLPQGIASIIGACSFTCGALCYSQAGYDRQLMYYQLREPTQQTVGSAPPPYTVVTTGQPSQCFSNPNVQQSMSEMTKYPS